MNVAARAALIDADVATFRRSDAPEPHRRFSHPQMGLLRAAHRLRAGVSQSTQQRTPWCRRAVEPAAAMADRRFGSVLQSPIPSRSHASMYRPSKAGTYTKFGRPEPAGRVHAAITSLPRAYFLTAQHDRVRLAPSPRRRQRIYGGLQGCSLAILIERHDINCDVNALSSIVGQLSSTAAYVYRV